jgi:inorganic pyrophosphatase/exopolyphosphatase
MSELILLQEKSHNSESTLSATPASCQSTNVTEICGKLEIEITQASTELLLSSIDKHASCNRQFSSG